MKKGLLITILAVVAAAAIGATIYFVSTSESRQHADLVQQRENIDDLLVFYADLNQLAQKGAFSKHITPENRRFYATAAKAALNNSEMSNHLAAIIEDLNNSGIDFTKPLYGYVNDAPVFIASVSDVAQLDKSVEFLSLMLEEDSYMSIEVERSGDVRSFILPDYAVTYNNSRIAIAIIDHDYEAGLSTAATALNRPVEELAIFGHSDMAAFVNIEQIMNLLIKESEKQLETYREWAAEEPDYAIYYESDIASLEESIAMLTLYKQEFKKNANIVASITFDPGRARLNIETDLGDKATAAYESIYSRTSNDHLKYFSNDVLCVMNYSINGPELAKVINETLNTPLTKEFIDEQLDSSEFNMIMTIAADVLKSINGDTTLGVENIYGHVKEEYDYYWDETYSEPVFKGIEAAALVDVTDKYIISNVSQLAAGFLTREGNDHYSASYSGFDFTLCQRESLLFASVGMTFEEKSRTADERAWAKEVDNSIAYMVFDIDNIMNNEFVGDMSDMFMDEMPYELRGTYQQATDMVSYTYFVINDITTCEFGVVFDDKRTNALEQLSDLLFPLVMEAVSEELF